MTIPSTLLPQDTLNKHLEKTLMPESQLISRPIVLFHNIRSIWKTQQVFDHIYNEANCFRWFLGGCFLDLAAGHKLSIRIAARIILVAQRWTAAIKSKEVLTHYFKAYYKALLFKQKFSQDHDRDESLAPSKQRGILSPSQLFGVRRIAENFRRWVGDSFYTGARASKAAYEHSNRIVDLLEAFSTNPKITEESIREFFINTGKLAASILKDDDLIIREFNDNIDSINSLLKALGFKKHEEVSEKLKLKLKEAVETTKKVTEHAITLKDTAASSAKRGLYAFTYVFSGKQVSAFLPEI